MKKKSFNKKLVLNKETISNFESSKILGGEKVPTGGTTCDCPEGASVDIPEGSWCTWTQLGFCK